MFVNGERLQSGARPVDELWPAIDRALKAEGIQPPPLSNRAALLVDGFVSDVSPANDFRL